MRQGHVDEASRVAPVTSQTAASHFPPTKRLPALTSRRLAYPCHCCSYFLVYAAQLLSPTLHLTITVYERWPTHAGNTGTLSLASMRKR